MWQYKSFICDLQFCSRKILDLTNLNDPLRHMTDRVGPIRSKIHNILDFPGAIVELNPYEH